MKSGPAPNPGLGPAEPLPPLPPLSGGPREIGRQAAACLEEELATWPKPGLVSPRDPGSHADADAGTFRVSAAVLAPFFEELAAAGAAGEGIDHLRAVGRAAEAAMLAATGGINTHRGALFGLGLLCAAAGAVWAEEGTAGPGAASLGALVRDRWGEAIRAAPVPRPPEESHGARVRRRYGAAGARGQAAAGFPQLYAVGLPALRQGRRLAPGDENAARVQACFALVAVLEDTNLLHRGGAAGLRFARSAAAAFLTQGGVGRPDWRERAQRVHRDFVARWLSPGGSADLLAMTLFVDAWQESRAPLLGSRGSAG